MAMSTTPYQRNDQIILSTDTGTVGTCTSFTQGTEDTTVYRYSWDGGDNYADANPGYHEHTVLSPASGSGRWHICWDEPPAPIGLDSRALRHLRKTGRRMSHRNYRQACKAVGRASW